MTSGEGLRTRRPGVVGRTSRDVDRDSDDGVSCPWNGVDWDLGVRFGSYLPVSLCGLTFSVDVRDQKTHQMHYI